MYRKILLGLGAAVLILQFFQIDKTNPEADPALDIINIQNPPEQVATMLKNSCYDCHSYNTRYPWYTYTQPLAWWIKDHIDHGREELNFSEWGTYSDRRADHKLEEAVDYTLSKEMPLPSYLIAHGDADLSDEQRKILADWFESLRPQYQSSELEEQNSSQEDH